MIAVPDEKTITGLTRTELIAMIYSLAKELDTALDVELRLSARLVELEKERDTYKERGGW